MKGIFLKHKILILVLILIVITVIGTKMILSQWNAPEQYVYLSTHQMVPDGRYDTIAARRYYDLEDTRTDGSAVKRTLDPSGQSLVNILRTQDNGASSGEVGCAELLGWAVDDGAETITEISSGVGARFVRFNPSAPSLPSTSYLSAVTIDENLYVGDTTTFGWIEMWQDAPPGSEEKHVYDIAEGIEGKGIGKNDVVIIDPEETDKVRTTDIPYDIRVAGVISEDPAIYLASADHKLPLSLKGKAYCKVTAINGPIKPGDLLVTSSKNGYAMLGLPSMIKPGMVIGKALERLEEGEGKILIWVSPG